jgi:phosphatidylglycerophosphate synthase
LAPGLVVALVVAVAFVVYLLRGEGSETPRRESSMVVPSRLVDFAYWVIDPVVAQLSRWRIHPNHLTALSLYLACFTGLALAGGYVMTGCGLLAATGACDLLDGELARSEQIASPAGAFFDSVADRVAEIAVWSGLAWYGRGEPMTWLALWAMGASLIVSYSRARGQSLGVDCTTGLMQRPERIWLLVVSLFVAPIAAIWLEPSATRPSYHLALVGIGLLAGLTTITAYRRSTAIFAELRESPPESAARDRS